MSIISRDIALEQGNDEINFSKLQKQLDIFIANNKITNDKSPIFDINNKNNESFQIGYSERTLDDNDELIIHEDKEKC